MATRLIIAARHAVVRVALESWAARNRGIRVLSIGSDADVLMTTDGHLPTSRSIFITVASIHTIDSRMVHKSLASGDLKMR
jgi:hypothetical protein